VVAITASNSARQHGPGCPLRRAGARDHQGNRTRRLCRPSPTAEATPPIEQAGDKTAIALLKVEQARALAANGELDEAQALAEELVRNIDHLSKVDAARALAVLADISVTTGNNDRALELYEAAANSLADLENAPMLAGVYERWFELLAEAGQTDKAIEVARRGMRSRLGSKAS
jgi:tetratricopeptide (TPR) repeat protein